MYDPENSMSEEEVERLLLDLFPQGFAGDDVSREIAPEGFDKSPLAGLFHPPPEQIRLELLRFQRMFELFAKGETAEPPPEPTLEQIAAEFPPAPPDPDREVRDLVGLCLWDIFSDNHEVLDSDGRVADMGSFRYAGEFLAGICNRQLGVETYTYIDFYLGTGMVSQRADVSPVHRMIFRRLRRRGCDWVYTFPRLHVIDMRPLAKALEAEKEPEEPEWLNYSPDEALAQEAEDKEKDQSIAEMHESLDEGYREDVAAAQEKPPPRIVEAFREVYGRLPTGWPPVAADDE